GQPAVHLPAPVALLVACGIGAGLGGEIAVGFAAHLVVQRQGQVGDDRQQEIDQVGQQEQADGRDPCRAAAVEPVPCDAARLQYQGAQAAPQTSVEVGECADTLGDQMGKAPVLRAEAALAAGDAVLAANRLAAICAGRLRHRSSTAVPGTRSYATGTGT